MVRRHTNSGRTEKHTNPGQTARIRGDAHLRSAVRGRSSEQGDSADRRVLPLAGPVCQARLPLAQRRERVGPRGAPCRRQTRRQRDRRQQQARDAQQGGGVARSDVEEKTGGKPRGRDRRNRAERQSERREHDAPTERQADDGGTVSMPPASSIARVDSCRRTVSVIIGVRALGAPSTCTCNVADPASRGPNG